MKNNYLNHKRFPRFLIFIILLAAVLSLILMLLWNSLMPVIFKLPSLSYWQALGLLILSKILFAVPHGRSHDHFSSERKEHWKKIIEEKMKDSAVKE